MLKRRLFALICCVLLVALPTASATQASWTCAVCGSAASGNFCANCGSQRPDDGAWICSSCGKENSSGNFCSNCGQAKDAGASSAGSMQALQVGDIVTLGSYEQDNLGLNGKEPIEWVVLMLRDGDALLMSKYILDCKKFNDDYDGWGGGETVWKDCSLRAWLNDTFYDEAFSDAEKERIVDYLSETGTGKNPVKTTDHVFLLSTAEAVAMPSDTVIYNVPITPYAKGRGLTVPWYWLRSQGKGYKLEYTTDHATIVMEDHNIDERGSFLDFEYGVRPCIWITN